MTILADKIKLDDVFKSTQDNFSGGIDGKPILALGLLILAVILLLVVIHYRRKRVAEPRAINHPGKLMREVLKQLPLRASELKQLKVLAEQEHYSSPLLMLLCPSLLAKGMQKRNARGDRRVLGRVAKKVSG